MAAPRPGIVLCGALLAFAAASSAATVKRAEDAPVTGRLAGIKDGKLVVTDAGKTTAVPLEDVTEVTLADAPATRPATTRATTTAATAQSTRPGPPVVRPASQAVAPPPPASAPASQPSPVAQPTSHPATQPTSQAATLDSRPWKLTLGTGDTLALRPTAWAGGSVAGNLVGSSTRLSATLPVTAVRELWCGTTDQVAAARALGESAAQDDVAYAVRDNKVIAVHGLALDVDGGALRFKFGGQDRKIGLTRLVGVAFARAAAAADAATAPPQQLVTLANGDGLPGQWTAVDDTTLGFTAAWGQPLSISRRDATKVTFRNGRVLSLSDLTPSSVEQTPYFDRVLPYQVDKGLDGKPIVTQDGPVPRGLAVHARTVLSYPLGGAFEQFRARVGFAQPAGKLGDAAVRVLGDGRVLYENASARGDAPAVDVSVPVTGVQTLTLEVDFGRGQDVGDRVVWANARVLRPQGGPR